MRRLLPLALAAATLSAGDPVLSEHTVRAHLAFLSSDLLEGRGTGQRGGDLAVAYLEAQMRALGLQPGNGNSFLQYVGFVGTRTNPAKTTLRFLRGSEAMQPVFFDEAVCGSGRAEPMVNVDAGVLFCGYGIQAAEERWDDFKDVDVRGKLLLVLAGEPSRTPGEPHRFSGESLTIHGRWSTKFEDAGRRGAAGILLIHTLEGATYDWSVVRNGFEGEKFMLAQGPFGAPMQGWLQNSYAKRLLRMAGQDLDALRAAAEQRTFKPVPLDLRLEAKVESQVSRFPQYNVVGILPGTDPVLKKELVIYSAHWDHLGIQNGHIYNGAVDNASGCAGLLAMIQASMAHPTKRSQMFLFPCGEEMGLLGSQFYVQSPLWPLDRTVANLNLESLNWVGPSRDIEFLGGGTSTLHDLGEHVAKAAGLVLRTVDADPQGLAFRSDHFPFHRAGIPAVSPGFSLAGDRTYLQHPAAAASKARTYLDRYHQESDDYDPEWDLRGMVQHTQFILNLGRLVANSPERPRWKTGH